MGCALIVFAATVTVAVMAVATAPPARAADWAAVVMYHRFGEDKYPATSIRLDQFEAHIRELTSGAYTVLPLGEIIRRLRRGEDLPDRTVAITIDDAYQSVYREAWPRLKAAGLPFTLFVATDPVDDNLPGFMSWDQIREIAAAGATIGSQSASHLHMPANSPGTNTRDLAKSNARFVAELGKTPEFFAYPYGEAGLAVTKVVRDAGFVAAFGQHSGTVYGGHDMFSLPRWPMNENYGGMTRFRRAINALPFRVKDVTPGDTTLGRNPPAFGFTIDDSIGNLKNLNCYSSYHGGPLRLERLGERRIEIRLDRPFPPGRGRINCTVPGPEGRWRWFGTQFYIPKG